MKQKKIVMIGPVYPYKGGISHYTGMMYRELSKKHDVIMISYKMQYPKILFKREQKDYTNDSFKVEDTRYLLHTANPFNIISVAGKIKREHPDMVIMQWWHPYFAPCYYILTKMMGKQNITFVCHNVFPHERFPLDKWLTKLTLKGGNNFVLHAQEEERELETIIKKKGYQKTVTPHPTYDAFKLTGIEKQEAREKLGLQQDDKVLLFFGFVREYKGLKYLLEAMPELIKRFENITLLIIGDFDGDKDIYVEQINKLKINQRVVIKDGYIPDKEVEPYFSACDLVMLPYVSATQSGIAQIAYGFSKPVIATRVGGLPDAVRDDETGYLIEPQNPEQIVIAVQKYYELKRQEVFEKNIKEESYRFSWERMGEVINNFF